MLKNPCCLPPPYTHLHFQNHTFPCTVGRGGVTTHKREGDGATPTGHMPFRAVYYRPDREDRPVTPLPVFPITLNTGWCDDPAAAAYNRPILLPTTYGAEALWRNDACYDIIIVMGHNDAPAQPHGGSALFVHLPHSDGRATAGCVALERGALLTLLRGGCDGIVIV
jgi:L,D-peptidoglycan transpeptidase YkuD (ErfK/YbiS/YcfS/YnhG family)